MKKTDYVTMQLVACEGWGAYFHGEDEEDPNQIEDAPVLCWALRAPVKAKTDTEVHGYCMGDDGPFCAEDDDSFLGYAPKDSDPTEQAWWKSAFEDGEEEE